MVNKLFNLLPTEIRKHLRSGQHINSFNGNLNNFLEYINEGADRQVFILNEEYVVKFDSDQSSDYTQSQLEYESYQAIEDKEAITEIIASEELLELGVIFAERVVPLVDYFYNKFGDEIYNPEESKYIKTIDYIQDFNPSNDGMYIFSEFFYDRLDTDTLAELEHFVGYVEMNGLQDIHSDNIGIRKDGAFVALDLGYGF